MADTDLRKRPAHRPSMSEDQLAKILGGLLILDKGTPAYRRKRRELAVELDRTERSIEMTFEQLKEKHVAPKPEGPEATS